MASIPRPHSPYFLVKVSKQKEKESKEKVGSIYIPDQLAFMQFNTQCGEIVGIGEGAGKYFPEAKVGHTLLIHHFVQGSDKHEAKENHLIHEDDEFHYYVVTAYAYAGKDAEAYGVWDGEKIIPNKEYVFLHIDKKDTRNLNYNDLASLTDEKVNEALQTTQSGILVFNEWKESRETKEAKQAELKKEVEELSKSGNNKLSTQQAIKMREWEMEAISRDINTQTYEPHIVAFANKELSEWFDRPIESGEILGILNFACGTTLNVNGVEYIVAKVKFIAYLYDQKKVA